MAGAIVQQHAFLRLMLRRSAERRNCSMLRGAKARHLTLLRSDFAYRSTLGRATGQLLGPMRLSLTLVRRWRFFQPRRKRVLWQTPIRSADLLLYRMPRCYLCLELAVPYCTHPSIKEKTLLFFAASQNVVVASNRLVAKASSNSGKSTIFGGWRLCIALF